MDDGGLGILLAADQISRVAASYVGENGGAGIPAFFTLAGPCPSPNAQHDTSTPPHSGGVEHRGEERS